MPWKTKSDRRAAAAVGGPLQLADAPSMDMDLLQWSRHYRLFPGQGAFDLTAFLGHVLAAGYTGPLSLEVFNDVFRQSDRLRPIRADQLAWRGSSGQQMPHPTHLYEVEPRGGTGSYANSAAYGVMAAAMTNYL